MMNSHHIAPDMARRRVGVGWGGYKVAGCGPLLVGPGGGVDRLGAVRGAGLAGNQAPCGWGRGGVYRGGGI